MSENFPDLGKREVLAALTRLPVAAREEGRRFRFTRRTLPRGPCSMEQQREKRKERRNEQLVAALADLDQERWHQQGSLSPQSAGHGAVSASPGGLTPDPKRQQPEQDDKDMAAPTSPQRGQSGLSSQADTPVPLHRSAASGRPQPPLPQVQCTMEVGGMKVSALEARG